MLRTRGRVLLCIAIAYLGNADGRGNRWRHREASIGRGLANARGGFRMGDSRLYADAHQTLGVGQGDRAMAQHVAVTRYRGCRNRADQAGRRDLQVAVPIRRALCARRRAVRYGLHHLTSFGSIPRSRSILAACRFPLPTIHRSHLPPNPIPEAAARSVTLCAVAILGSARADV